MKNKIKIRLNLYQKLTIAVLAVVVLLSAVSLWVVYIEYKKFIFSREHRELAVVSEIIANRIESEFINLKKKFSFVALHNKDIMEAVEQANAKYLGKTESESYKIVKDVDALWNDGGWENLKAGLTESDAAKVLKDLLSISNVPLTGILVADKVGGIVATTSRTDDYDCFHETWWQNNFKNGAAEYFSYKKESTDDVNRCFASDSLIMFSCPVLNKSGEIIGALKIELARRQEFSEFFNIFLGKGKYAGVMRSDGVDMFYINFNPGPALKIFKQVFNAIILKEGNVSRVIENQNKQKFILGFSKISESLFSSGYSGYVYCLEELSTAFAPLKTVAIKLFLLWVGVNMCLFCFIYLILRKFTMPIRLIRDGFRNVKDGFLEQRLEIVSGDELEDLAGDFNSMVEELRKNTFSRNHFNEIIKSMSDILFVVDPKGLIDLANKRTCEILGYSEIELKGKEAIQIFSKKDRYVVSWGLKGLIEEGALKDKKIDLISKSGSSVEVYLGTRSLKDGRNNFVGLVCLAKDLTEMNNLMDDLKKSNEEILEHKQEVEKSLQELTDARDVMLSILEDTDESKHALEDTFKKLKSAQDELLQAEKMASLGQIAAGVAHEINNPLFVISGESEMLNMEEGLAPSAKESIRIIREQVIRIGDIIKRLLEFSKKRELTFGQIDINALLDKTVELSKYQIKMLKDIEVVKKISKEVLLVSGDQNQLQEVFLNLVINAMQSMESNGGVLTISTFSEIIKEEDIKEGSKFKPQDRIVNIKISDTGGGIPEEVKNKIFDPFFTTKKTGTGLGLSVCHGIIENHKGRIEVESQTGKGTTFIVQLPIVKLK